MSTCFNSARHELQQRATSRFQRTSKTKTNSAQGLRKRSSAPALRRVRCHDKWGACFFFFSFFSAMRHQMTQVSPLTHADRCSETGCGRLHPWRQRYGLGRGRFHRWESRCGVRREPTAEKYGKIARYPGLLTRGLRLVVFDVLEWLLMPVVAPPAPAVGAARAAP